MLVVSPIMSATEPAGRLRNLILAKPSIDRASELRTDPAKLDELWLTAKILILAGDRFQSSLDALVLRNSTQIEGDGEKYFLGIDRSDGQSYFAWHLPAVDSEDPDFHTLREVGSNLSDLEAGLAVHAVALGNWHRVHPMCSRCGAPTRVDLGGAVRICDVDESQHHPRTDPAVIVLVKDQDDRIILGHQPIWPDKRFSNFAGFVEPGESFEQCVVREVAEESGVIVHSVSYLGSQPWPFPASIMIAFEAVTSDPSTAVADGVEITEIRWFSRAEMKAAVASQDILLPPPISVARRMIEHWYGPGAMEDLQGGDSWRP
ncbi:unannotated protein [freshwater metagenome]|uniref:NAD(+) diphosphatase n=1 Tax=freshwater metagenome TaxID=449393 RepID=A0A6J7M391_9ZZZZ